MKTAYKREAGNLFRLTTTTKAGVQILECSDLTPLQQFRVPLGSTSLWIVAHLIGLFTCSDLHYNIFDRNGYNPRISQHHPKRLSAVPPRTVCGGILEVVSSFPIEHPISILRMDNISRTAPRTAEYLPSGVRRGEGPPRSRDGPFDGFTMQTSLLHPPPRQKWPAGCSIHKGASDTRPKRVSRLVSPKGALVILKTRVMLV